MLNLSFSYGSFSSFFGVILHFGLNWIVCATMIFYMISLKTWNTASTAIRSLGKNPTALWTVDLSFIYGGRSKASQAIFFVRDGLKMFWVNTISNPTQMVNGQTSRDLSIYQFIGKSVGLNISIVIKSAIAFFVYSRDPKPTSLGFFNLLPKSNLGIGSRLHALFKAPNPFPFLVGHGSFLYNGFGVCPQ